MCIHGIKLLTQAIDSAVIYLNSHLSEAWAWHNDYTPHNLLDMIT